jgi:hypothetical protein
MLRLSQPRSARKKERPAATRQCRNGPLSQCTYFPTSLIALKHASPRLSVG